MRKSIFLQMLLMVLALPSLAQQRRSPPRNSPPPLTARDIAKKTIPSVVLLIAEDASGKPIKLGSGFLVTPEIIVTNYHVIKGASSVLARNSTPSRLELMINGFSGIDEKADLALLSFFNLRAGDVTDEAGKPARYPWPAPLTLAKNKPEVGDEVYVVGNPEGLEGTFSQGIVSSLRGDDYFQITAPISQGSSGGPVLNKNGEVIGIAVAALEEGQNINFAVPVAKLLALISRSGKNPRPLTPQIDLSKVPLAPNKPEPCRDCIQPLNKAVWRQEQRAVLTPT